MKTICLILLLVRLVIGNSDLDALLELKKGIAKDPSGEILVTWDSKSLETDGCPRNWYGISCIDGRVTSIALIDTGLVGVFDFSAISRLKMLRNLTVSKNQLSGAITKEVGLNEALEYLDLHSNGFSGDIMHPFAELGSVVYFDLSDNNFTGSLDIGLGNLSLVSSVRYLNISHNNLGGVLFPHDGMPFFDNLEVFDASDNHFIGNIPSFNFIVSLRVLRLGKNQLSGSLPEALLQESSTVLTELDISQNQLEGPVGSIGSATLRNVNLSFNRLSGPLPAKVEHCAVIDLSNNMLSGNLSRIQSWGNYIEIIELSSNSLTGTFPYQTSDFLRLTSIKISNNSLEGVLPPVLTTYPELRIIDFSLNHLSGFLLPSLFNSTRITHINMSFNGFEGSVSIEAIPTQNISLISLDLSHNELTGELPPELEKLQNMVYLDLSHNHFEGGIPSGLPKGLEGFNVSYNNLSGSVPENLKRFPESAFHPGNYLLVLPFDSNSPPGDLNVNPPRHSSRMHSVVKAAVIAGVVGGASIIALVILLLCCRSRKREYEKPKSKLTSEKKDQSSVGDPGGTSSTAQRVEISGKNEVTSSPISIMSSVNEATSPSNIQNLSENPSPLKVYSPDKLAGDLHLFDSSLRFTAEELSCAPAEIVGTSCHGTLYKAVIVSGHLLAVKWLKEGIAKGRNEFAREARKLGNIRHPNLVTLRGYYWGPKDHEKLIISNYVDAPCLALYLHDEDVRKLRPLALNERFKIAIDVARCLNYLHNERSIPHGNLKSTNILVETHNSNALLTDYSLHRIMTSVGTTEQVLTAGALGYRPPEFATTSRPCPSLKSDVYAFGVILLELLTGKNPEEIIPWNSEMLDMTEWVRLLVSENDSIECFDRHILETQNIDRLRKCLDSMLQIALKCILSAAERPDMKMIFEELSATVLEYTTER